MVEAKTKYLLLLFIAGGVIFFFNIGGRDLWEPDETRYAVTAREMVQSGNWILPHLNGQIYAEKPPLFFWLVNLSTFFLGENTAFSNRLPSALAGLSVMLLTFLFGSKLFNPQAGFLSSLILASCFLFPQLSRWVMFDSLFTLLFFLSLFYFYRGFEIEERRRRYYLFAGLFMGLGVLTKGPISYLSIPIFLIFAFSQKEVKKFWNQHFLMGFVLSLVVVLIWLIPACWIGGEDYTKRILFGQTIGRLAGNGKHFHAESFLFYFIRFPLEFFPWIVFLPTAFILGLRKEKEKRKEFLFLSIWFIFIFLFFTISRGKKDNYILPLYPAAAIFVGWLWDSEISLREGRKGMITGLVSLTLLFMIVFILSLSRFPQTLYPGFRPYLSFGVFVFLYLWVGSTLSLFLFLKQNEWASSVILVIVFIFFHLHLSYALPSKLNTQRSMKAFSERIVKRMEAGDELKTFFSKYNGLLYYTNRSYIEGIGTQDHLFKVLESPQRVFIVIQAREFDQFKKDSKIELKPIEQTRVGRWDLILISNR